MGSFIAGALAATTHGELQATLLPALVRLVPADRAAYFEIDRPARRAVARGYGASSLEHRERAAVEKLMEEHPVVAEFELVDDQYAAVFSETLSPNSPETVELFGRFCATVRSTHELAVGIPGPPAIGLWLTRAEPAFSDDERAMLEFVGPHVATAFARARERDSLEAYARTLEDLADQAALAIVYLDDAGHIERATREGLELSGALAGGRPCVGQPLPASVATHLRAPAEVETPASIVMVSPRGEGFTVGLLGRGAAGFPRALVLSRADDGPVDREAERLGLTPRELQVLRLVAGGLTDAESAAALSVSVRTVQKHLENVYAKLGVHTRTGAVMRVFSAGS